MEVDLNGGLVDGDARRVEGEEFTSAFIEAGEAIGRLTFEGDRDVVVRAVELVRATYYPAAGDAAGPDDDDAAAAVS